MMYILFPVYSMQLDLQYGHKLTGHTRLGNKRPGHKRPGHKRPGHKRLLTTGEEGGKRG